MCNITVIYLPTSSAYCCYTTLGNIGCSSEGLTGQDYAFIHRNWCRICQDARALFSSILALRLMVVILVTSYWCLCSRCFHTFFPLLATWPLWSSAWLTHGTDCHRVSLMMLSRNGGRDLGPVWTFRTFAELELTCMVVHWTCCVLDCATIA